MEELTKAALTGILSNSNIDVKTLSDIDAWNIAEFAVMCAKATKEELEK